MPRNFIRTTVLSFLILLSLVLTWVILTVNDFGIEEETKLPQTSQAVNFDHIDVNIIAPAQIIYHGPEGMRIVNSQNVLSFDREAAAQDEELTGFRRIGQDVAALEVFDIFQSQPTLVHVFDHAIPFSNATPLFGQLNDEVRNQAYNFMAFPMDDSDRVLFYNSESQDLFEAEARGVFIDQLVQEFDIDQLESRKVDMHVFGQTPVYLPLERVSLAGRDFLLERIPNNIYVDQLFDDPSEVNVRYLSNSVRYNDLYSELSINEDYNLLIYSRQGVDDVSPNLEETIDQSFEVLNRYENWPHGLHYDGIDAESSTVSFRRYIDGYPIFSSNGEDRVEIGIHEDYLTFLQLNLTVAQTPLDTGQDNNRKILENGSELVEKLNNSPLNMDFIQSIRLGYHWRYSDESRRVVHFIPAWFVNYNSQWYSLEELLENDD